DVAGGALVGREQHGEELRERLKRLGVDGAVDADGDFVGAVDVEGDGDGDAVCERVVEVDDDGVGGVARGRAENGCGRVERNRRGERGDDSTRGVDELDE